MCGVCAEGEKSVPHLVSYNIAREVARCGTRLRGVNTGRGAMDGGV